MAARPPACSAPLQAPELGAPLRSEEHTSELQSLRHVVCRLLLEKKNCTVARRMDLVGVAIFFMFRQHSSSIAAALTRPVLTHDCLSEVKNISVDTDAVVQVLSAR